MARTRVMSAVVCVLCIALPSLAAAQERKGFWISFGIGAGFADLSAENAAGRTLPGGRDGGALPELGLGWAVNQQLLAGVEVKAMGGTLVGTPSGEFILSNVSGTLTYYPNPSANFFVRGGIGGSFLALSDDLSSTTAPSANSKGFGLTAAAGYDIYLGRGFSLTPAAGFWYGQPGGLDRDGQTLLRNWQHNVIDFTLSVKFN